MSNEFYQPNSDQPTVKSEPYFGAPPPPPPPPPLPSQRKKRSGCLIGGILGIALLLLGILALILHNTLPASAATITFRPLHQTLLQTPNLTIAEQTDFASNLIAGHKITFTTPTETKKEKTISRGHLAATGATGKLVIVPQNATTSGSIKNMILRDPSGIEIDTDQYPYVELSPNRSTTVPAHVVQKGQRGNIPAYFINNYYNPGDDPGLILLVYNPAPFTGGKNAYDGPLVQDSDINQVKNDLSYQVQQEAQEKLQKLVNTGEAMLNRECTLNVQSPSKINAKDATVTAKGSATCTATAYNQQELQTWLQSQMPLLAKQRFGPHLSFVRQISSTTNLIANQIQVYFATDWSTRLDTAGRQTLIQAILGKSQEEGKAILSKQFSAQIETMNLSGWGINLPTDPKAIQLIIRQ